MTVWRGIAETKHCEVFRQSKKGEDMNRKFKLFFSLASLCLSVAMLCFGVYSAMSVSYTVNGSVSYEVKDVFVNINTRVYRATSTTPIGESQNNANVTTITNAGENISSDFAQLTGEGYTNKFEGYDAETGVTQPGASNYDVPEYNVPNLTYGAPDDTDQTGYAFYIVIDIENLGSETINAVVQNDIIPENTLTEKTSDIEIEAKNTGRIVLGLSLEDVTKGITKSSFGYTIAITRGQLPAEITDLKFSFDEEKKEATVIGYTGTSGEMVIPETVGNHTNLTTKTLKFENVSEMMSTMGGKLSYADAYSIADISYTVDGEKKTSNKDLVFAWSDENPTATDITITFLSSYEINYEDYTRLIESSNLGRVALVGPIGALIEVSQSVPSAMFYKFCDTYYTVNIEGEENEYVVDQKAIQQFVNYNNGALVDLYTKLDEIVDNTEIDSNSFPKYTFTITSFGQKVTEGENYKVVGIKEYACMDIQSTGNPPLTSVEIPASVQTIGQFAFANCTTLTSIIFKDTENEWTISNSTSTQITSTELNNPSTMATYLKSRYSNYIWTKNV